MKIFFGLISFLLIHLINSAVVPRLEGCDACQLGGYFVSQNGYGCFLRGEDTICTCPDNKFSTKNSPCRICQRSGICGPQNAICSEQSDLFLLANKTAYFACFCLSGSYLLGEECPIENTPQTLITTTPIPPSPSTPPPPTATIKPTEPPSTTSNSNIIKSIDIKTFLIVIFPLVYLINI